MSPVRIMLTVVTAGDAEHDVILHADPGTPLAQIAGLFGEHDTAPVLYAGDDALDPALNLGASPLRYGARIGLGHPLDDAAAAIPSVNLTPSAEGTLLLRRDPPLADQAGVAPRRSFTRRVVLTVTALAAAAAASTATVLAFTSSRLVSTIVTGAFTSVAAVLSAATVFRGNRQAMRDELRARQDLVRGRPAADAVDPEDLMTIIEQATDRLWERGGGLRSLALSVGTSDGTPIAAPVLANGAVAIDGPRPAAVGLASWLVAQLATLRGPDAVQLTVLTDDQAAWEWVRWLPHCRPPRGRDTVCLIGNDLGTAKARVAELNDMISAVPGSTDPPAQHVVVFDGGDRFIPQHEGGPLLTAGPGAGIYSIFVVGERRALLFGAAATRISVTPDGPRVLPVDGDEIAAGQPYLVTPQWCERMARALAPVVDPGTERGLPESSRLLDLLDLHNYGADVFVRRWSGAGDDATAVIGETADGPYGIDLVRDGPHLLVGGTTGSGKTEFLRTLIVSLAASYPPDLMTFLLIDYKGGGAYGECARLPHTAGLITDLDVHLVGRTLTSLNAELRRREYLARNRERLPRLLIVVDEISALLRELPDFVDGLTRIAARGRPLGIHLIVSSQRPSLVADHAIGAEANLRVALRMSEPEEAETVLGVPGAPIARSRPGRCQIASTRRPGEPPVPVQVGTVSKVVRPSSLFVLPWFTMIRWGDLGRPEPGTAPDPDDIFPDTDLVRLAGAIRAAADQAYIGPAWRPVLPPLPETLLLSTFLPWPEDSLQARLGLVPFGLADQPAEQAQSPAVIDFATFDNMVAVGPLRSGRSQLLRTLGGSIAMVHSTARVHLYAIDGGDGVLAPLADLPHCGAVLHVGESERTARLFRRLDEELSRRQELLAQYGSASGREQLRGVLREQHLPDSLVMIDGWEIFARTAGKTALDAVGRLLREGPKYGVFFAITADALDASQAWSSAEKLVFGRAPDGPAGRARWARSQTEVQVALLDAAPTIDAQGEPLRLIAAMAAQRDADVPLSERPFRIDDAELESTRFHVGDANGRPFGREDVLAWLRARHASGTSVALLGPRRAGKTWVLGELERRLIADGRQQVHNVVIHLPSSTVETPDALARVLDPASRSHEEPAQWLLSRARDRGDSTDRLSYLLDEVGRLVAYGPAAVSWLRDLGQAGAWLVYTGTESDWRRVVRWALKAPGSSFGNDVDAAMLGPITTGDAIAFLRGTAANLRVNLDEDAATLIAALVDCWPFYLQVVGDAAVRAVQSEGLVPDDTSVRELIEARLLDGWTSHFEGRWTELGLSGQTALLKTPGRRPGRLTAGQRNDLRDAGLLRPGDAWLADRPFFDWIARNAAELRDRNNDERLRA